mgnify:FL=1
MAEKTPRMAVLELLLKVSDNAYSNLALDGLLNKTNYCKQDKAFISRLFYGVIERQVTLDYIISLYSSKPLQKLDKSVHLILCMGIYQLLYMDSVPDNAAVNESVNLIKQLKKASASGFVNAILRSFIRDNKKFSLPDNQSSKLSILYSCTEELAEKLICQYGYERAENFLASSLEPHKLYIRANNTKISAQELLNQLKNEKITAVISKYDSNCIETEAFGSVEANELYRKGYFHVQDLSSQLCCAALSPQKEERILDICAAPGGKTFTLAEITEDSCEIIACELHSKRVDLIRKGAERLQLKSIKPLQNDAKIYNPEFGEFDKILCDVPCSGFGVIRSKPEIKYTKLSDIERLPQIQYDILSTASKYLKVGGDLVYSTCTVLKDENDMVIDRFLEENTNFKGEAFLEEKGKPFGSYKAVIFPEDLDCEGFFISKIKRIK